MLRSIARDSGAGLDPRGRVSEPDCLGSTYATVRMVGAGLPILFIAFISCAMTYRNSALRPFHNTYLD